MPLKYARLRVGSEADGTAPFEGKLQELRIFGEARSEEQIAIDVRRSIRCDEADVAVWQMSEGGGTVATELCARGEAITWQTPNKQSQFNLAAKWTSPIVILCPGRSRVMKAFMIWQQVSY